MKSRGSGGVTSALILWRDKTGLISPDGTERQSSALGLLHEISHAYYSKTDPYGKEAELDALFDAGDAEGIAKYDEQMAKDVGDYDNYRDKWIIENVEINWKNSWKRKS